MPLPIDDTRIPGEAGHIADHNTLAEAVDEALTGRPFTSASAYTARSAQLILDPETTSGWVATNCTLALDTVSFTLGTAAVRINTLAYAWDNNPTRVSQAYVNLGSDVAVGEWSHIALDMRWNFTGTSTIYQPCDFFELVASNVADWGGDLALGAIPAYLGGPIFKTLYIPIWDLDTVRSIGIRYKPEREPATDFATVAFTVRIDNIRFAEQSELERALANSDGVFIPASYAPSVTQKILDIPSDKTVIDLRHGSTIVSNHGGTKHIRQTQLLTEDGSVGVMQDLQDAIAQIEDGDYVILSPEARYLVSGTTGSVDFRQLRDVVIDGRGARIFADVNRDVPLVRLMNCKHVTFRNFEIFGSSPRTDLGSTFTTLAGSPSVSGTTIQLDALGEMVRPPMGVHMARDVDHEVKIDLTLSDSAQVANDCVIEIVDEQGPTTAPTAVQTADTYGAIAPGTRYYAYSYRDVEGNETNLSLPVAVTLSTYGTVQVTNIGLATKAVPAPMERVIYRTKAGQTSDPSNFIEVGRIYDNTTTSWLDRKGEDLPTQWTATIADVGTGNVQTGYHEYAITFVNSTTHQESSLSPDYLHNSSQSITLTRNAQVTLGNIPAGPAGTTSRNVYRTKIDANATEGNFFLVGTISNNTDLVSFTDNLSDASVGVRGPDLAVGYKAPIYPRRVLTLTSTATSYRITAKEAFPLGKVFRVRIYKATATPNTITCHDVTSWGRTVNNSNFEAGHCIEVDSGCDDVTIEDCLLEGVGGDGVNTASNPMGKVTIRNTVVRCVRRQGIDIGNGGPILIEDCEIREPARSGLDIEIEFESRFGHLVQIRRVDFYDISDGHACVNLAGNGTKLVGVDVFDCRAYGTCDAQMLGGSAANVRVNNVISPYASLTVAAPSYGIGYVECDTFELIHGTRGSYGGLPISGTGSFIAGPIVANTITVPSTDTVPIGSLIRPLAAQPQVGMTPLKTTTGVPTDADFPYTPPNGTQAIGNTATTPAMYVRLSGVWTSV